MTWLCHTPAMAKRPTTAMRVLRAMVVSVGIAAIFMVSLVFGLLLHLDTRVTRAVARDVINATFRETFAGRVALGDIEVLTPSRIALASFTADTPTGERTLAVTGLRVRGSWLRTLLAFAAGSDLQVPRLRLQHVSVDLSHEHGSLSIVRAFSITRPAPPSPVTEPAMNRRRISIHRIEVDEVRVAGEVAPGSSIDARLSGLRAALDVGDAGVQIHVDACTVTESRLAGSPIHGDLDYHLTTQRRGQRDRLKMWGGFDGRLGELEVSGRANLDDGQLAARFDLPRISARALSPWVPDNPLVGTIAARATVFGKPPLLRIASTIDLPSFAGETAGKISLEARLVTGPQPEIDAEVVADAFDARVLGKQPTRIAARARVRARFDGANTVLLGLVRTLPSVVAGEGIGRLEGTLRVAREGVDSHFRLEEPGAPTDLGVTFRTADGRTTFAARAAVDFSRNQRLPQWLSQPGPTSGGGQLLAEGQYAAGTVDVATRARLRDVRWPSQNLRVDHAVLDARVTGQLAAPQLDADMHGRGLIVDKESLDTFAMTATGSLHEPLVIARMNTRGRNVALRANLDARHKHATAVRVEVTHGAATVTTSVASVRASPNGLVFEGVEIDGLGSKILGGLRIVGAELFGKLRGDGVDLAAVSRVLGLPFRLNGAVDLDIDLRPAAGGRRGYVAAKIHNGRYLVVNGIQAELRLDFDGKNVVPTAKVQLVQDKVRTDAKDLCEGTIATLELGEAQGTLNGALLDPASWRELSGSMRLTATDLKLACAAQIWQQFNPARDLPFRRLEGLLNASAVLSREHEQRFASVIDLQASTSALVYEPQPEPGEDEPAFSSDRLDMLVLGSLDGTTGKTNLAVHLIEGEGHGDLAHFAGSANLDLPALLGNPSRARTALLDTRLSASVRVKRGTVSRWAALPKPIREHVVNVRGEVELEAFLQGSVRNPSVALRLRGFGVGHRWGLPSDVDVLANYHGGIARLDAKVHRDGSDIAAIRGESRANLSQRLFGIPDDRWTGWVSAHLHELPLETLPPLARSQVSGAVSGHIIARGLGDSPTLSVQMSVPLLRVGPVKFVRAEVTVDAVPSGKGMYTLRGELPLDTKGGLSLRGYGHLAWRDELIPVPEADKPAGLHVVAKQFPLASFQPLVAGNVSHLEGYIDGGLRVRYHDLGAAGAAVDVNMKIVDGAVYLPGQELEAISATIVSQPSIIQVTDINVASRNGLAKGSMNVRLDGLELTDITGTLTAAKTTPMPLILEGVPLGSASGTLIVHYKRGQPDSLNLSIADLLMELPASAGKKVQTLDEHPQITVSHAMGPEDNEDSDDGSRHVRVTIALQNAVLEKGQTRIGLSTSTPLTIDPDGTISGVVAVVGGQLNLLGKVFVFERGLVRLRAEDKNNPYVNVTARWSAPDGTVVYVDYVGLVKALSSEKIRFRSTPPLSQAQILSLLLLGDADAGTDRAANLTRGIAAAQFNALLGDIAPGLSTSFATSEGYIGTTLIYQLSESVTARATVEQANTAEGTADASDDGAPAEPAPGSAAGQNGSARTSVSVDWRFAPNWLIRGTVGVGREASSGLDVLYQFRY